MLEQAKYVNHLGEVIEFGKNGIFANSNDLRDYAWLYDSDKNRIENFRKGVVNKTIPFVIFAQSEEEGIALKNKIFEVFEKDVISGQFGKIFIGEYYMNCFITASTKTEYLTNKGLLNLSATIVSDTGNWIKETRQEFIYSESQDETGKGYEYGFEYDYAASSGNTNIINNSHFGSCDFIMKISGYAHEPSITIGDHTYKVNDTIQENEILTIDSKAKTIILTKNNGVQVNLFSKREKSSYIFDKIPSGNSKVYWNSGFNFELTLFEERSEPKWI